MDPDDEIVFGRALDESRSRIEQIEALRAAMNDAASAQVAALLADLTLAIAVFELHGATLRSLARWYPSEDRIRLAMIEWDLSQVRLAIQTAIQPR